MLEYGMFVCPGCRRGLTAKDGCEVDCSCGESYALLPSGGIDFLQGGSFDDFKLDLQDPGQQDRLREEAEGVAWRVRTFILPLLERFRKASAAPAGPPRALDVGCGSGMAVDALQEGGVQAWGIDAGLARQRQWPARKSAACLHAADALRLPFANRAFDFVISSGLIEHIGIHEEASHGYRSRRLTDCHDRRTRFISELVRVTRPDGFIYLDHPNGRFPIDFWHGGPDGGLRWHVPWGDMLPTFSEVSRYFAQADPSIRLFSLSPAGRLRFIQVRRHWYGRAFSPLMKAWLAWLGWPRLSFLARSFGNPYLVTVATRAPVSGLEYLISAGAIQD
jgi:SAM-dependent methyltransferase